MATPYSVPSIDDIIYSRSRVPSMQQITFNNLLTAIQKVQESKETQKEREFLLERDRRSEEAATARDRLRVTAQSKRDLAADKWKKGQAKEALRQRNEDLHREDVNEAFDLLESLIDDKSLAAADSSIRKIEKLPGYDERYADRIALYREDLAFERAEKIKDDTSKDIMRNFWSEEMSWEDVLTSDFMMNATEDQFDRLLRKRNLNEKERTGVQDAVFDSDLALHDNNIKWHFTQRQENYELADTDGKKALDDNLNEALGSKESRIEQEYLTRGLLKPKDAKATKTVADALAELNTLDTRTALSTFIAVAKPGGQMTPDLEVLDAMEAEVKAGRTIPIVSPDSTHITTFKSRQQAINDGDIPEDYRYDEENPPAGVTEAKDDKLLENTKNLSGFGELMETLNDEMISEDMVADRAKGYGANQRWSNNSDEPGFDVTKVTPEQPQYVPKNTRELFGYVRQIDTQLNKYRKMAIRNKKDKKVVDAAEGVKQWAIMQLSHLREVSSQPGMYDKKTGNLIVKLVNTIDSTLERLQDDSWIYKSYGFRPSRRGTQKAQPMGMQPGTPQMIR